MSFTLVTSNTKIDLTDLTHSVVDGNGVFDKLMKAVTAHLEQEFQKGRIKGTEYSTVYLSAMQGVLEVSLQFVLAKEKANKELELLEQQKTNLALEAENIPKQGLLLDAQTNTQEQQKLNLIAESLNIPKQGVLLDKQALDLVASTEIKEQEKLNLVAESLNIPKQGEVLDKQVLDLAQATALKTQQTINAATENTVLTNTAAKVTAEKDLLIQRKITEEAQVDPGNILPNSILDKNRALLVAQTEGYARDAEQKAAKIMADAFAVQATVDENTLTTIGTASLSATDIGSVITKLKTGIGI